MSGRGVSARFVVEIWDLHPGNAGTAAAVPEIVRAQPPHGSAARFAADPAAMTSASSGDASPDRERPPALVRPAPAASQPPPMSPARRRLATATPPPPPPPALVGLAAQIDSVVRCLDGGSAGSLDAALDRCNAALESCLETARGRATAQAPAQDELRELALLLVADVADAAVVMRRIRRVLGRIDAQRGR
jgi:hypothetical protein